MDKQPCCEGERQYFETVNEVIPKLGHEVMDMFVKGGFSIPRLIEKLWDRVE